MFSDKTNLNDALITQEVEIALPSSMPTPVHRIQGRETASELVLKGSDLVLKNHALAFECQNFGVPS